MTHRSLRRLIRAAAAVAIATAGWFAPGAPSGAAAPVFDGPQPLPVLGSSGPSFPIVGNFAGSSFDDIFSYVIGSGADKLLISQGNRTATVVNQSVTGNYDPIVGQFGGDSHDDIFWYAFNDPARFSDSIWISRGDGTFTKRSVNVRGEYEPFVGDFKGEGFDSLFWYAPGRAADSVWNFDGAAGHMSSLVTVNGFYDPVVGDFADGPDGHIGQDIVWKSTSGSSPLWTSTGAGFFSRFVPMSATGTATAGSFGGGDHDDLLIISPGSGPDVVMFGPFTTSKSIAVGGTYSPVVGEFNGDGLDDVLWDNLFTGPDPIWLGAGDGDFTKAGQVDLQPVSAVHKVQVGAIADPGVVRTDDVLVFAGTEGGPTNQFQLYYGISSE